MDFDDFFAGLTAYLARKIKKIVYTFFCNKQFYYEKSALGEKSRNRKWRYNENKLKLLDILS